MVSDNRNLPNEEEWDEEDGRIQNKNIIIDLQPIFLISAFEKNSVNYDQLQYFNSAIEAINIENNYDPLLTITNIPNYNNYDVFNNFILFFNAKLEILENAHNYVNRGIFRTLTGNYNGAINDLNNSLQFNDKNLLCYFTRGNCRFK